MAKGAHTHDMGITLTNAFVLAREAHEGQVDKSGEPYILHPQAVANMVQTWGYGPEYRAAAYLHDVLEDTNVTEAELRALFPEVVADAVVALTHRKGETRKAYYERVKRNEIALIVKRADVWHNGLEERLAALNPATQARLRRKYAEAKEVLG